jgi:serine/threonine-protein kinase
MVGRQLGSFRLLKRLGSGGMGSVYLAEHVVIGSRVAVKVLHPSLATEPTILQRFHAEARAVNLIGHDNILKIYDLCREDSLYYLIMEYLEGRALSKLTQAPLPADKAIPLLLQVCDALAAAHDHGVVHRDLKPENVFLVERRGRPPFVKLLDFGVAKLMEETTSLTAVGMIIGTPTYMAPEQFRGGPVDARTDIYAMGVMSYQLATGVLPFNPAKLGPLMRAHLETPPTPPAILRPEMHRRWSEITLRAMAKDPDDRYPDVRSLQQELLSVLDGPLRTPAPPPRTLTPPPVAPARPTRPAMDVDVLGTDGSAVRTVLGTELTKDGVFLAGPSFAPPLFSPLKIALRVLGGVLRLDCEVVRHVSSGQAIAWGMSEGVGVQFVRLTSSQKRALAALVRGDPIPAETPPSLLAPVADPEPVLAPIRGRSAAAGTDPYALLDVSPDADAAAIRARARELRRDLQSCHSPDATPEQRSEAASLELRVLGALQQLTEPLRRAEYDAARGNYAGVAQAIAGGLTVTELERLRRRFLDENPRAASHAALESTCGRAYEQQGEVEKATLAYERALRHDPLDLMVHQRFSALRRRKGERAPSGVSEPAPSLTPRPPRARASAPDAAHAGG